MNIISDNFLSGKFDWMPCSNVGFARNPMIPSLPLTSPRGGFDTATELWKESISLPAYSTTGLGLLDLALRLKAKFARGGKKRRISTFGVEDPKEKQVVWIMILINQAR